MGRFSKGRSRKISSVKVIIFGAMGGGMSAPGRIIRCMGLGYSLGLTEGNTKVSIKRTKKMAMAYSNGQTDENMKGNGRTESSMALENGESRGDSVKRARIN